MPRADIGEEDNFIESGVCYEVERMKLYKGRYKDGMRFDRKIDKDCVAVQLCEFVTSVRVGSSSYPLRCPFDRVRCEANSWGDRPLYSLVQGTRAWQGCV